MTQHLGGAPTAITSPGMLLRALQSRTRVGGQTHSFYRYPARFSPEFARTAIATFTAPGDLVLDPFVGGGTSAVEAMAAGRQFLGTDLSELAVFVSRAKTAFITPAGACDLLSWADQLETVTRQRWRTEHMSASLQAPWVLRKTLSIALATTHDIKDRRVRLLARASLLRVGQWALDGRRTLPSKAEFLVKHRTLAADMAESALTFAASASRAFGMSRAGVERQRHVFRCRASSLTPVMLSNAFAQKPKLILTSPPYHGIHILYHRWQIQGRRETNLPFFLSGTKDGQSASYYTFGGRCRNGAAETRESYFRIASESYKALAALCDASTTVLQLVGFSDPPSQLPLYQATMKAAGFAEVDPFRSAQLQSREVPNRRWYLEALQRLTASSREFLLAHRIA